MLSEKDNILEFNQYMKSDKMLYIIYADIASLIKKIDGCENNPENSLATKIGEHIPCGYSMSTIWVFDNTKNKHTLYHGDDCMKKFCEILRKHAKNIIDFEKKKMLLLTKEELSMLYLIKSYRKVRDHSHFTGKYRGAAHSICNLRFHVQTSLIHNLNVLQNLFHSNGKRSYKY